MTADTIRVSTLAEFDAACARFASRDRIYFRGQTHDFPAIQPSLFRSKVQNPAFEELVVRLYIETYGIGRWEEIRKRYLEATEPTPEPVGGTWLVPNGFDFELPDLTVPGQSFFNVVPEDALDRLAWAIEARWRNHSDALLQHYGVPSRALDITAEPWIALWFATNAFAEREDGTHYYVPQSDGSRVVYVFPEPGPQDLVDLGVRVDFAELGFPELERDGGVPYFGLRGIEQRGLLLLGATSTDSDLRPRIMATIELAPGDWSADTLTKSGYTYPSLIVPPERDRFYASLLRERALPASDFRELVEHVVHYSYT
jgi:hypothetical protein